MHVIGPSLTIVKYYHTSNVLLALTDTSHKLSNSGSASSTVSSLAVAEMLTDGARDSMIN